MGRPGARNEQGAGVLVGCTEGGVPAARPPRAPMAWGVLGVCAEGPALKKLWEEEARSSRGVV